jgi:signal transduction histidine kinase
MGAPTDYKLLLIDDDEDEYVLMQGTVRGLKHRPILNWVDNFEDGFKAILAGEHDAYLIDYYLGAHTGVDLLRAVRERDCRAPIIILTGRDDDGLDEEALAAGATDYLDKNTLNGVLLGRAVRYAIHQQRNQNHLEDLVRQVSKLEQLKTDMIRIAAHDLRNPLTVMRGYIEMLQADLTGIIAPGQQNYLVELRASVEKMQKLVRDILSSERIAEHSGGYTDPVDFSQVVQAIYEEYSQRSQQTFTHNLPDETVVVYGSEPELREAVRNLMSNAVKYTPAEGIITVTLSADSDIALFTVTDNGYGIPEDKQDQLFKPFFRAKTPETRKIDGTGLGLHLVKNIVERHNGQIHFESVYRQGSTFGFMLPQVD